MSLFLHRLARARSALAGALFAALCATSATAAFSHFVTRSGDQLFDGPNELRFISTNMPDALQVITNTGFESTSATRLPDAYELRDAVVTVQQLGGQVLRTFSITARNGPSPVHMFDVSTFPVVPNEAALQVLDRLLQLCNEHGVRVYIPLIAYSNANRGDPATYGPGFWNVGSADNLKFKDMVAQLLNRTNTLTGVPYRDDKAILGWQSGNELVIAAHPERRAWLHDLAAYVKSLDANHLFMDGRNRPDDVYNQYDAFFADENIDVVSYHTYVNLPAFNTPASTLQAIRTYTAGLRPLIVSEIAMYTTEAALVTLLNTQIANGTTGSNWWGHRFRNREGGFYRHSDNGSLFEDLNWPGFPDSADYLPEIQKALNLQDILATRAYEIQGLARPPLPVPAAPILLPIADPGHISWEGPTGAQAYDIERAFAPDGPWTTLRSNYPEHLVVADALYCDELAVGGATYFYRVVAKNTSGASAPSNVVGPVAVSTSWLVDDFFDLSRTHAATNVRIKKAYNHYNYSNDLALLVRGNTTSPGGVVYRVDGHIRGLAAYLHQSTVAPTFAGSVDGVNFTPLAATPLPFGSRRLYQVQTPHGSSFRFARINLNTANTNEAIGRVEIEYAQPTDMTRAPRFSVPAGNHPEGITLELSSATPGALIRYTTNGSTPTATTGTLYTGPITLTASTTVTAVASRDDLSDSFLSDATYVIGPAPQTLLLEAEALPLTSSGATTSIESDGPASAGKWSKLNGSGVGQSITYTTPVIPAGSYTLVYRYKTGGPRARHSFELDGQPLGPVIDPYASTSFYLGTDRGTVTFPNAATHTIRLTTTGRNPSSSGYLIGSDAFTFTPLPVVAAPVFNLPEGTYPTPPVITLHSVTAGAALRYTLDGSIPDATSGILYTGPFTLTSSATVRAIAYLPGMTDSPTTVSNYTVVDRASLLTVTRGGYLLNRRTNRITQQVTLTNPLAEPVTGPLYLVLDALSGNTTLLNASGYTGGSPYLTVPLVALAPGASVSLTLEFARPAAGGITATPRTASTL